MDKDSVNFSGKSIALLGLLVAAGMAIGIPVIVLKLGTHLHAAVQTTLIILAGLGGVVLGVVCAFFGIVIPTRVNGHGHGGMGRHVKITRDGNRKVVEINGEPVVDVETETEEAEASTED